MAVLGTFGKAITFTVNAKKVLSFSDFKKTVSGRWEKQNICNKKPKSEFLGPEADQVTLRITLNAQYGVKPKKVMNLIEEAISTGVVAYLVIGGKLVSKNKFYIETMEEEWKQIWNKGELVSAEAALTFTEYT